MSCRQLRKRHKFDQGSVIDELPRRAFEGGERWSYQPPAGTLSLDRRGKGSVLVPDQLLQGEWWPQAVERRDEFEAESDAEFVLGSLFP